MNRKTLDTIKGLRALGHNHAADVLRDTVGRLEADARALWSVRVLDAWKKARRHTPKSVPNTLQEFVADNDTVYTELRGHGAPTPYCFEDLDDFDAARHTAALAVFPTLPADVRAKLGECP